MSTTVWSDLQAHHKTMVEVHLRELFKEDPNRFLNFSLTAKGILLDYSKQRITQQTLEKLCKLADSCYLSKYIEDLFTGKKVNFSEQRAVLHTALRDPSSTPLFIDGQDVKSEIHKVQDHMIEAIDAIRNGGWRGATGKQITDIISLGIGGSDLGPSMVCQALDEYKTTDIKLHFVSNVDGKTLASVLKKLDPKTTLCIVNSKTFTTPETLQNAKAIKMWFSLSLGEKEASGHLIGVTANPTEAEQFGILKQNIFEFWDFVGGRYSVWSAVGLPIALLLGGDHFKDFLAGANAMDEHFRFAPFLSNMPVLMALLGIWNINFWDCRTHAIIAYDDGLRQFPDYLQQLEMESNGKKAAKENGFVDHATAPIIWGGVGCNGQHAYMQLLHQGTQIVPVDFLIAAVGHSGFEEHHRLLMASCLSQSKALMEGNQPEMSGFDPLNDAKQCFGNRPSNTLVYSKLTPRILGSLIALYEHKVFVQGVIWGINSFDQWGVELGKKLVKEILPYLKDPTQTSSLDSSTKGLICYLNGKESIKIP